MPNDKAPRAPHFFDVPAGTPSVPCTGRHCDARIYKVFSPGTGTSNPIRCDVVGGELPTADRPGRGLSHFADCPDAAQFRTPRGVRVNRK